MRPPSHVAPAPFIVVVTGLQAEARIAAPWGGHTIAAGGDAERLMQRLRSALLQGAEAVLSFGLAGGLDPALEPGSVIVPDEIIAGSRRFATDGPWSARLRERLPDAVGGALAGVDAPLPTCRDKGHLHRSSDAVAVDMESHWAAEVATGLRRPFAVLRVIADPAQRSLPPAAVIGMKPDGGVNLAGVMASLLRNPRQLPDLLRVAADARAAMRALARCRRELGPELGWRPATAADRR